MSALDKKIDYALLESAMLGQEQVDCPLTHRFSEGIYLREIFMPAGTFVLGCEHKTKHFNNVIMGRCRVLIDGEVKELRAPCTFESGAGVRKALYVLEDTIWQTIHANPEGEEDISKLEGRLVNKSDAVLQKEEFLKLMEDDK